MRGFTLVSQLLTISLIALLGTLAFPSIEDLLARQRVISATNQLVGLLHTARAHGMSYGHAYLCDGIRGCEDFGWTHQVVLTETPNATGSEPEVLVSLTLPRHTKVTWRRFRGSSLYYNRRGQAYFQNGHFLVCHEKRSVQAYKIVLNWTGRPRTEAAETALCENTS